MVAAEVVRNEQRIHKNFEEYIELPQNLLIIFNNFNTLPYFYAFVLLLPKYFKVNHRRHYIPS